MPGQFFHSLYSQFKKGACWAGKSPIRVKRVKPVFFTFPFRQHPDEFTLIDIVLANSAGSMATRLLSGRIGS